MARRTREDGAPSKREAPEPKNLRARSPVVGTRRRTLEEEEVREKPNDLLSAIKRGANLRKVAAPPSEPPKTQSRGGLLGNEVDKILNLRAKIAAASESSSDDSGSDWD